MNVTDIQKRIQELFAAEPEAAGAGADLGRVVVWYDPAGEFADVPAQLELPGVEVLVEEPNRLFELKRRLNEDLAGRRVLLYRQRPEGELADNWLADVEAFATPFKADLDSLLMADVGARDTLDMRRVVHGMQRWLKKKSNAARVRKLMPQGIARPAQLRLAVMASVLGKDVPAEPAEVLAAYLARACAEEPGEPSGVRAELESAGVWEPLGNLAQAFCAYAGTELDARQLAEHVLAYALAAGVSAPARAGLERVRVGLAAADERHLGACAEVAHAWARRDKDALYDRVRAFEEARGVPAALASMGAAACADADALPCVDEVVISELLASAQAVGFDPAQAMGLAGRRRPLAWSENAAAYYNAACALAQMRRFEQQEVGGFARESAGEVWAAYTGSWYAMDTFYRQFCRAATYAVYHSLPAVDDDLRRAQTYADGLYAGFVAGLSRAWEEAAGSELAAQGYASGPERQELFYMDEVAPLAKKGRAFVVVSDALRYEVGVELAGELERRTRGKVEVSSAQAAFPSVTECGMAALLPHASLRAEVSDDGLAVAADGMPTAGTEARQACLRRASEASVAVQASDFMQRMGKAERLALTKDASVVYVYHNRIDATGEDRNTESDVFGACEQAVSELANIVETICRDCRCSNVLITADHGFLYTAAEARECDKVASSQVAGDVLLARRRFVLARPGATSEDLLPVSLRPLGGAQAGFAPHGALRVKVRGALAHYAHGGASLQELCVPVLRFKNLRRNASGYVETHPSELELVTCGAVTGNDFKRVFFQKEPVGGKVEAATYRVELVDAAGAPVSEPATLAADRTSAERADREIRVGMRMRSGVATKSTQTYYLQVTNTSTNEVALRVETCVDIAFQDDFDLDF